MTDSQRVLELFRKSGGKLISNAEIMSGDYFGTKPIATYTARITDARDLIHCDCGIDEKTCKASEHIRNVKKNWYQYIGAKQVTKTEPARVWVDVQHVQAQLSQLREKYKTASGWQKDVIRIQGQALKRSIELQQSMASEVKNTIEALV